jgi:hypothetical protein
MSAAVLTISPRMPLDRAERIARGRVERDGVAVMAADSSDRRQVAQLRRLHDRLTADDDLDCFLRDRPDGTTWLSVIPRGQRPLGWWGDAKTG